MSRIWKKSIYLILFLIFIIAIVKVIYFDDYVKHEPAKKSFHIDNSQPIIEEEYKYVLKEYNGKLAVFGKGKKEPEMIFDVLIESLPEVDVVELKQGLKIKDDQELKDRIEDFVS